MTDRPVADEIDAETARYLADIRRAGGRCGRGASAELEAFARHLDKIARQRTEALRELATLKAVPVDGQVAADLAMLRHGHLSAASRKEITESANRYEVLARAYAAQSAELTSTVEQLGDAFGELRLERQKHEETKAQLEAQSAELAELHGALHFAATSVYHQLVFDGEAVRYEAPNGEVTACATHNCESAAVAAAFLAATELVKASKAGT